MGAKMSKEDGLTAALIERLYAAKAAAAKAEAEQKSYNSEPRDADNEGSENEEDVIAEDEEKPTSDSSSTSSDKPPEPQRTDTATTSLADKATAEALRNAAGTSMPNKVAVAGIHLTNSISAFGRKASRALDQAIEVLRQIGIIDVAKAGAKWMKKHPWETAAIFIPLILLACTPAFLSIAGFGAGGIAAGSTAAGVQAGIGSVTAGSTFAIFTSAAMGGYGVPIVFGGVWAISTAVMGGVAAWKRFRGGGRDGGSVGGHIIGGHNGGDGGGGCGGGGSSCRGHLLEGPSGDGGDGDGGDDDYGVAILNGIRGGGGGGNSGGATAVLELAAANEVLLKQDRVLFYQTRM